VNKKNNFFGTLYVEVKRGYKKKNKKIIFFSKFLKAVYIKAKRG